MLCYYVCSSNCANIVLTALKSFIEKNQLFTKSDRLALAISGGRDSVCMAHLLNELSISFVMVHVNFKLRGNESDQDEAFVQDLAKKLTHCTDLHTTFADTKTYARDHGLSVQEAARNIRYAYFKKLKDENRFDKLITAHHQDDLVETFFINLYRVSGIKGLKSIPHQRDYIVRPLLALKSSDIVQYASDNHIEYREDKSNQSTHYLRNNIRHNILPKMQQHMPDFVQRAAESISILQTESETLDFLINRYIKEIVQHKKGLVIIPKNRLLNFPQPSTLLYRILDEYGFNPAQCAQIIASCTNEPGRQFWTPTHRLTIDRTCLMVAQDSPVLPPITIEREGSYTFGAHTITLQKVASWEFSDNPKEEVVEIPASFFPLTVRTWRQGDRFTPLGMKGSKLVSDFFIDHKLSVHDKDQVPLVCSNDQILWIVGFQIADEVKVHQGKDVYRLLVC